MLETEKRLNHLDSSQLVVSIDGIVYAVECCAVYLASGKDRVRECVEKIPRELKKLRKIVSDYARTSILEKFTDMRLISGTPLECTSKYTPEKNGKVKEVRERLMKYGKHVEENKPTRIDLVFCISSEADT